MSKGAAFFTLLIAIFAGLIASYSVSNYIQTIQAKNANDEDGWKSVVIAKSEIPAGEKIKAGMLAAKKMQPEFLPDGIFTAQEAVIDRVPMNTIFPGEMVLQSRLADAGAPSGLPAMIPDGHRAITLKVDDTIGVGGFIQPGNFVDIVTTVDVGVSERKLVSKVILQNVLVIATGSEINQSEEKKSKVVPTVTVLVSLEKAERLALATSAGSIRLVLRSHADKGEEMTEGVTLANLIPQANQDVRELPLPQPVTIPEPEPKPEPTKKRHVVELYKGTEKSEISFQK